MTKEEEKPKKIRKGLKIEVTVRCINEYDNTGIYSCNATYCSEGNTLVQSEVDDYTKTMASDALYQTSTLLKNQVKTELSDETTVELIKRAKRLLKLKTKM